LREILGREDGAPPPVDLALEKKTGDVVRALIEAGQLRTVHDLSDGGLIAALCEMALASNLGAEIRLSGAPHTRLFAEDQARYLIACEDPRPVLNAAREAGLVADILGDATGDAIALEGVFSLPLADLRAAHEGWMPAYMGEPA